MADGPMVALAALHLEGDLLFTTKMLHNIGYDRGICNRRRADKKLIVARNEKNAVERDRLAGFGLNSIHSDRFAGSDTILLSTCF